jgi:hypothetical protein
MSKPLVGLVLRRMPLDRMFFVNHATVRPPPWYHVGKRYAKHVTWPDVILVQEKCALEESFPDLL